MAFTCSTGLKEVCFIFFKLNWELSTQCADLFPLSPFQTAFQTQYFFQCDAENLPFNTIASSLQLLTVAYAAVLHTRFVAW